MNAERESIRPRTTPTAPRRRLAFAGLVGTGLCLAALGGAPYACAAEPAPRPAKTGDRAPTDARMKQALALHDEALALYERGQYRAAISKLEEALALDPNGKELLYNLALIHEKLAEVDVAEDYYRRYLSMETDPALRERTQAILRRISGAKGDVRPAEPKTDAAQPPSALPPPRPKAEARPLSPWFFATSGLAATALITGVTLGISAVVTAPGDTPTTSAGVSEGDLRAAAEAAHRRAVFADISFATFALLTGVAVYLYASRPSAPSAGARAAPRTTDARPWGVSLNLAAGRGGVRVVF